MGKIIDNLSEFAEGITCIWGNRGSGKTTLARKMIAESKAAQVVIIDPMSAEGHANCDDVIRAIYAKERVIVCRSPIAKVQRNVIYAAFMASTSDEPVFILCDEAPSYLNKDTDALSAIVFQGRHRKFGMILLGQRPTALAAQLRSQPFKTFWLRLADPNDIDFAAKTIGREKANRISTLKPGEFIEHPPRET